MVARESGILSGQPWFNETFKQVDPEVCIHWQLQDGERFNSDQIICDIKGNAPSILTAERTALNFLQTLSGIATTTNEFVTAISHSKVTILDTRKTIPGLRHAQKYAVRCGGAQNHRMGLYDGYLIKENHISACGSITLAVNKARDLEPDKVIEVEVETLEQLEEAIKCNADIALLDNFELSQIKRAAELAEKKIKLEVSGNVSLNNLKEIADNNIDFISTGAITKHLRAIDFSLLFT